MIPEDQDVSYRDHPAIAQSDLKTHFDNPAAFHQEKVLGRKKPEKSTPSMAFGNKIDTWLTSPQALVEIPDDVLAKPNKATGVRARTGKAWEAFEALHEGQMLVTLDDIAIFDQIRTYAEQYHPKVFNALFRHKKETKKRLFWDCPHTGIGRKCEIDIWLPEHKFALDIKTTQDPSEQAFGDWCWRFGYHIQAATYIEGLQAYDYEPEAFGIIAIRNDWPYDCEIYEIAADALAEADEWNRKQMLQLADDLKRDEWIPATAKQGIQLTRPASWAGRRWDR